MRQTFVLNYLVFCQQSCIVCKPSGKETERENERAYLKTDYESSNRIISKRVSSGVLDNGAAYFDSEMDKLNGMHKTTNGKRETKMKEEKISINENGLGSAKKPTMKMNNQTEEDGDKITENNREFNDDKLHSTTNNV